ncbi:MAG: hypothetical protein HWE30_16515 [Methylocystaceae bacterium]|nr:hypothetical protein [Methylocystaceae bacterium]
MLTGSVEEITLKLGLYAIGFMMVFFQAVKSFNQPLEIDFQHRFKILSGVEIHTITSSQVLRRGLMIYVSLYLLAYIFLLVVWGVLTETAGPSGRPLVGLPEAPPLKFDENVFFLDQEGVARPIYVATFLVALISADFTKRYESVVRRFAHARAGVPDGIYRVAGRLERFLADYVPEDNGPLVTDYETAKRSLKEFEVNGQDDERIRRSLSRIDLLGRVAVSEGDQYSTTWTLNNIRETEALDQEQIQLLQPLKSKIAALEPRTESVRELSAASSAQAENLIGLFSVLFIKNGSPVAELPEPTASVVEDIQTKLRDYHSLVYFCAAVLSLMLSYPALLLLHVLLTSSPSACNYEGWVSSLCNHDFARGVLELTTSRWLSYFVLFILSGFFALNARKLQWESGTWEGLKVNGKGKGPIHGYAGIVLPVVFLTGFVYLFTLVVLSSYPYVFAGATINWSFVTVNNLPYFAIGLVLVLVSATSVLIICDVHDNFRAWVTISIAVGVSVVVLLIDVFFFASIFSLDTNRFIRETLVLATFFSIYLVAFSVGTEVSEKFTGERN